jgi:hypothetical protein
MNPISVRTQAWAVALAIATIGLALMGPAASAATFSSSKDHYHFSFPDGWNSTATHGADAAYAGPEAGGFAPNVVAIGSKENAAKDNESWLFNYTRDAFDQLNATFNLTQIQAPRTFTTASGRLAGDYIVERNESGTQMRQRQVLFVSDIWNTAYVLTLTDNVSTYSTHESEWTLIVDSFGVDGEPEIPPLVAIMINGSQNTSVEPNISVRFALNQTLPGGLVIEWFRNGTSVGAGKQVDLSFAGGDAVITVTISNATATRTLTTTVYVGGPPPAAPPPTPPTTAYGDSSALIIGAVVVVALIAAGLAYFLAVVRPKRQLNGLLSPTAPPAAPGSPPQGKPPAQ